MRRDIYGSAHTEKTILDDGFVLILRYYKHINIVVHYLNTVVLIRMILILKGRTGDHLSV